MRKSLTLKFILGYLLFALLSFVTIATLSSRLSYWHSLEVCSSQMRSEAVLIAEEWGTLYMKGSENTEDSYLLLTQLAEYLNASIWIMDSNGLIVYDSGNTLAGWENSAFDPTDTTTSYRTGNFYGTFSQKMLTVSYPITANFRTWGYVLLHVPLSTIATVSDGMLIPLYLTFVIIFAFSLVILMIFRVHVARPLKTITAAANEYAAGNLHHELSLPTEDEMGYLANTLNFMAHELSNSEEYQRKFIANVSHDFRSPLTSIKGYLEAIIDGTIPHENQEKYLKIVIAETERLAGLTQSMLSLNSLDRNRLNLTKEDFDLNAVIKATCATFEGVCDKKDISFDLTFSHSFVPVYADRGKIQQVIYNLVDNAIKFSPNDSLISIEVYERHEKIFFSIKDQGVGIPKENIKKIWTRFYKSDESRGKDKKGTGLGLAIVKEIIQAHGETIDVISTEGVGTEFIFRLPKGNRR